MKSVLTRWIPVLLAALLLGACQTMQTRGGDSTGDLGAPSSHSSPGDIFVQLGTAYLQQGRLSEALRNARKAAALDPNLESAQYLLGIVYERLGERQAAEAHYRNAVALAPRDPNALNALGTFVCGEGKYAESEGYFRRALANPLYQTPWIALFNAGRCNEQADHPDRAEDDYRKALQLNPRFAPALLRMAHRSYEQGHFLSARAYLERYAAVSPATADSLLLGARTETRLGDTDEAAKYENELRVSFPDSEQAKFLEEVGNL